MKRTTIWAGLILLAAAGAGAVLLRAQAPGAGPTAREERNIIFISGEGSWLGVEVEDVTAQKAHELKLPGVYGALVTRVEAESPAARAGLKAGDVILDFAGERVRSVAELTRLVRETPPDRSVAVKVSRSGKTLALTAQIARRPESNFSPRIEIPPVKLPHFDFNFAWPGRPRLGILANDLTPQLAQYFGVQQGKGVLVTEVNDGSAAQKAGLKAGDVIVKVGSTEVDSVAALRSALRGDSNQKRQVALTIVRNRQEQKVTVDLPPVESLMAPERVAELRDLGMSSKDMEHLRSELQAQSAQLAQSARQLAQAEALKKQDVQRTMQEHKQQMEQLKKQLRQLRLEMAEQPI
jgi:serine protease Do